MRILKIVVIFHCWLPTHPLCPLFTINAAVNQKRVHRHLSCWALSCLALICCRDCNFSKEYRATKTATTKNGTVKCVVQATFAAFVFVSCEISHFHSFRTNAYHLFALCVSVCLCRLSTQNTCRPIIQAAALVCLCST